MTLIYLRATQMKDLQTVFTIIKQAQTLLKNEHIDQWQDGQPSLAQLQQDILHQQSYVLISKQHICGTAVLLQQPEPNYLQLQTAWHSQTVYATIHRFAIAQAHQGQHLGNRLLSHLITLGYQQGFCNFRIDTHPNNLRMQHLIKEAGFIYRGSICLNKNPKKPRLAYELNL
ncbi:GNAT family N-acetyltransferase [Bombilactobacillus bombi]|uniref:GNAT family N-acetyltransferase n=1 Tax=Bombilactobacillus bombi TaxID=1303590 RepID=A0A3R6VBG9_9LACO|nr:GNAT family N-acetyltransferase [Bombilactobacillus bombi]RHW52221.1 GNAT family N-acetyltransferase [Bombilactobacillus bombi]